MRKELIDGTQTANADTGWVEVGNENAVFSLATVNIEWKAAAGTSFDGEVKVYLSNNAEFLTTNLYPKHSVDIDAATSVAKDNSLGLLIPFKFIRVTLTLNTLTTVDLYVDILYDKVKA